MKKFCFIFLCLNLSFAVMAQKAIINFDSKSHDFGKVNEEDGKIVYVFDFVNKGTTPLVVSRVQASCGCTTPIWTKEPIEAGKKGSITVTYNPAGRPGAFTKSITVYSNATQEQEILTIQGDVIPKPSTENSIYPVNMGGLMLKTKVLQLNNVDKGKSQVRYLSIQNSNKYNVKPSVENLPSYITVQVSPEILKPNEEGKITFTFNSKDCAQWGPFSDDIYMILNGQKRFSDEFKVLVVGNVVEDFGRMTLDQKRKAPILEMPVKSINLGVLKAGSKKKAKFMLMNKGQNSLEVRRIINTHKELIVRSSKMSVSGGKSTQIVAELNTKNLSEGDYTKSITIQTNDPDNSFLFLVLSWTVKK